ncbi:MAG: tetratricopeptide (TPR) repeat protein, partial [Planctomycetota bacterium]
MTKFKLLIVVLFWATASASAQDSLANAEKLLAEGRFSKSIAQFDRLITRDGRKPELLMGLGKSLFGLKEGRRSQALFQEVMGKDKNHSAASFWIGRVLSRKGLDGLEQGRALATADLRDAVSFYRDAADCASNQKEKFDARFAAGQALMYLLDFDEALKELRFAKEIEPENDVVGAHMMGALYRAGDFEEFLALARKRPDQLDRLREFDAVLRLGRIDEAKSLFLALIEKHGFAGQTRAYDVLDLGCQGIKNPAAHMDILEALVTADPKEFYALYYLGYAQAIQGNTEDAEETFGKYLKAFPNNWRTTRHLANVQRRLGKLTA